MSKIRINQELKELIPPLSTEEFKQLKENIIKEGCRDPLVLWDNTIVDGHNRYKICVDNNIEFNTISKEFDSIDEAKVWMIDTQKGRRNLTDGQQYELMQVKRQLLLEKGEQIRESNLKQFNSDLSTVDKSVKSHNTRDEIAKELGWSTGKTAQADYVWKHGDDELKDKVKKGEESFNSAYKQIKKVEKQQKLAEKKAEIEQQLKKEIGDNIPVANLESYETWLDKQDKADLLITDPPYMTDVDDIETFANDWLPKALNKVKDTGRAYVCVGAYPKELQAYLNVELPSHIKLEQILPWTYRNTLGVAPKDRYIQNWQAILYFKGVNAGELNVDITNEQFAVQDINAPDGRIGDRYHTWQKPIELADRLIRHSTNEGDTVIDPFTCTGTFLLSASKLDRVAKGCDISEDNLKIAEQRGVRIE